jgi:uncharacterized protein involved in exopolysaccharide biosynthesis
MNTEATEEAHEQLARLKAFLRRTLRFWRIPLHFFVLGVGACIAFLHFRTPLYRSETVILYSEGIQVPDDAERPTNARSVTVRLKEILMSRSSLAQVATEFDLYTGPRRTGGPVDPVEELRKHIEFRAPGGDTFSIAFTGTSAAEAQAVTARLATLVIEQDSELRRKHATLTRDFLVAEKKRTETRLEDAETKLASFMVAHPRFALDVTPLTTGAAIRANLGTPAATPSKTVLVRRPLVRQSAQAVPAQKEASKSPKPEAVEANLALSRANAAFAAARTNLVDLSARFTPAHPDVRAAQNELERARSRLSVASAAVAAEAPPPVSAPRTEESSTSARPPSRPIEPTRPSAAPVAPPSGRNVVELETEWVKLTRSVTEARKRQDDVEGALFKANTAVASESAGHGVQVTLIDPAYLPQNAVPPGRTMIVALFLGAALLLGILGAAVRAFTDDGLYTARDVTRFSKLLVEVPRASHRRSHV